MQLDEPLDEHTYDAVGMQVGFVELVKLAYVARRTVAFYNRIYGRLAQKPQAFVHVTNEEELAEAMMIDLITQLDQRIRNRRALGFITRVIAAYDEAMSPTLVKEYDE